MAESLTSYCPECSQGLVLQGIRMPA
uniref:Uncharacterized protein n=1 Tax=Anguilla anguilla TaxID=7936 RepID=A0A0E9TWU0_ANGAN